MGKKKFFIFYHCNFHPATPICEISAAFTVSNFSRFHAATGTKAVESETRWKTLLLVYIRISWLKYSVRNFPPTFQLNFRFQRAHYLYRNATLFEQEKLSEKKKFFILKMKNQILFFFFGTRNLFIQSIRFFSIPLFNSLCSQLSWYNRDFPPKTWSARARAREADERPTRNVGVEQRDRSWWSRRRIDRDVAGRTANLQIDSRVYTDVHTLNVRSDSVSRIRVIIVRRTKGNAIERAPLHGEHDRYRCMRRQWASRWLAFLRQ